MREKKSIRKNSNTGRIGEAQIWRIWVPPFSNEYCITVRMNFQTNFDLALCSCVCRQCASSCELQVRAYTCICGIKWNILSSHVRARNQPNIWQSRRSICVCVCALCRPSLHLAFVVISRIQGRCNIIYTVFSLILFFFVTFRAISRFQLRIGTSKRCSCMYVSVCMWNNNIISFFHFSSSHSFLFS